MPTATYKAPTQTVKVPTVTAPSAPAAPVVNRVLTPDELVQKALRENATTNLQGQQWWQQAPTVSRQAAFQQLQKITSSPQEIANYIKGQGITNLQQYDWWNTSPYKQQAWDLIKPAPVVPSPTQQTQPLLNQDIATQLGQADGTFQEYQALVEAGAIPTAARVDQIKSDLGIPGMEKSVFSLPAKSTEQLYNDAYAAASLGDVKKKLSEIDDIINQRRGEILNRSTEINDNPFLSEASRVGRLRRLQELADNTVGNLLKQREQLASLYDRGVNDVSQLVARQTTDFSQNQQINQSKLNYLLQKAESQVSAETTEAKRKGYESVSSFLKARTKKAPQIFGSATTGYFYFDKEGNLTPATSSQPKLYGSPTKGYFYLDANGNAVPVQGSQLAKSGGGGGGSSNPALSAALIESAIADALTVDEAKSLFGVLPKAEQAATLEKYLKQRNATTAPSAPAAKTTQSATTTGDARDKLILGE